MADDERPAVGTVAQEAARLLDALGGWAASAQSGSAARPAHAATSPDGAGSGTDSGPGDSEAADSEGADSEAADFGNADFGGTGSRGPRCESCGAENGVGQAVACQLCPVCQGISLLRSVRPETVDRLADLAGALAATLKDIAGQRRAAAGTAAPRSTPSPASRVQDIVVDDEDAPGSATS